MPLDIMKGIHGTCVSRAKKIKRTHFRVSRGLKGDGVYFWAYTENENLAKALAVAWWKKCYKANALSL